MQEFVTNWLLDPTVGKIVAAIIGLLIVIFIARLVNHSITRYVNTTDTRYRLRKFVTFLGYVVGAFLLTVIFSDRRGGLTVAFAHFSN